MYKIEKVVKTNMNGKGKPFSDIVTKMPIDDLLVGEGFLISSEQAKIEYVRTIVYRQNNREVRNRSPKRFVSRKAENGCYIIRCK